MKRNKIKCYKLLSKIKDRKIKHKIKKGKNIKYISIVIFILLLFLLYILTDFIIFKKLIKKREISNRHLYNPTKVCLCTPARKENRYIREFVQHYKKYGVDKIFLYDNNDLNGENFDDILKDYVSKGFVEVLIWRGVYNCMYKIMNDCYRNNYKSYDWFIFY